MQYMTAPPGGPGYLCCLLQCVCSLHRCTDLVAMNLQADTAVSHTAVLLQSQRAVKPGEIQGRRVLPSSLLYFQVIQISKGSCINDVMG